MSMHPGVRIDAENRSLERRNEVIRGTEVGQRVIMGSDEREVTSDQGLILARLRLGPTSFKGLQIRN
jgi:hypothetical protein